ncbi:hypothetical protein HA402_015070 [Bradysia odoriphaga]|nr:hypothetical protein HA402_015070 [Bradysia odoriphaga]
MAQLNQLYDYVANALEVVEMKLIRDRNDIEDDSISFSPEYAHQVFGENESIFGYRDLKVRLYYTAGALNMYLGCKYSSRVDERDGLKADDVTSKISQLLTSGCYFTSIDEFCSKLSKDESFVPFGEMVDALTVTEGGKDRHFEFYTCDANTPGFVAFHTRMQTFVMWFVDAASYIDLDDPQWMFYVCYEKYTNSEGKTLYATVGYTTIYVYYAYPEHIRPRISQMLVLPPFQKLGIGSKFIQVIYNRFKFDDKVIDITVEDPSDEFRRIRNVIDVRHCKELPSFSPDKIKNGFTSEMVKEATKSFKINPRQCRIIYEILRLRCTNVNDEKEYKAYRLEVKKRLNVNHHKQVNDFQKLEKAGQDISILSAGIPTPEERMEQLKLEYKELEEEYQRIIDKIN